MVVADSSQDIITMKMKIYNFRLALIFSIINLVICSSLWAQVPEKMSYQAVIRNSSNVLVQNTQVSIQISILKGSIYGESVYVETQKPTTNANGLVSFEIGGGWVQYGDFSSINWGADVYFVKTETDIDGGTNYSIINTNQLLSVPYALHAKTAESIGGGSSFYLGKEYLDGIIFHLYTDNSGVQRGLVVSKIETKATWGDETMVGADRTEDGAYNMALMPKGLGTARAWVETLGADWYLPSIDELSLLWHNRYIVNKTARAINSPLLSTEGDYWSSTEYNASVAFFFFFGSPFGIVKTDSYNVRAIRSF